LAQHDIGEEEWQAGLDLLAKEYLKGEGELHICSMGVLKVNGRVH
jgi:hypothetical protein